MRRKIVKIDYEDIGMIDPHVHCRDQGWAYKDTIEHAFRVAEQYGISTLFDMPNNSPPTTSQERLEERLKLVPEEYKGRYFTYMGVTSDAHQLQEAVRCYFTYEEVIGLKMFAGHSVGDLSVPEASDQQRVYILLRALGFDGVLAVHSEKESFFDPEKWIPDIPSSHNLVRPPVAEIESVYDQIKFAKEAGFLGTLHIPHVSCPETVEIVDKARSFLDITCGVTPHHLLFSNEDMETDNGLLLKTNPPLRDRKRRDKLRLQLKQGLIDWVESDHAPHPLCEKLDPPYLSGYPSQRLYPVLFSELFPRLGISKEEAIKLTRDNIIKVFDL